MIPLEEQPAPAAAPDIDEALNAEIYYMSLEEVNRRFPYCRTKWLMLQVRRVIQEWPARQPKPVQPRVREVAEQLNEEGILTPREQPWTLEKLYSYMQFHDISILALLPEVPAWTRTQSDNDRIRQAEMEAGTSDYARSWSRKAKPPIEAARTLKIKLTAARINQFFSVARYYANANATPDRHFDDLPIPRHLHYETFPWEEVCAFLRACGDSGPTNIPWQVHSVRRFLEKCRVPAACILNRFHDNVTTYCITLSIDPEEDKVLWPVQVENALKLAVRRMRGIPDVPLDHTMNPETGVLEPVITVQEDDDALHH